jgi:hypothetical protein
MLLVILVMEAVPLPVPVPVSVPVPVWVAAMAAPFLPSFGSICFITIFILF